MSVSLAYQATLDANNFNQQIQGMIGGIRNLGKEAAGIGANAGSQLSQGLSGSLSKGNFANAGKEIGQAITGGLTANFGAAGQAAGQLATALGPVGVAGLAAAAGIIALGTASISTAAAWEKGLAGISKTTGIDIGTAEFENLNTSMKNIVATSPLTSASLQSVVSTAGSLGVAKGDLAGFAQVAVMMGNAFELPAEQAAVSMGKIMGIMKPAAMSQTEFAQKMGSAVNTMGNDMNATEADVLDFSTRVSGSAQTIGMSAADVAGWGGVMASVFPSAERAAGSFDAMLGQLTTNTEAQAQAGELLGVSTGDFMKQMTQDPSATILKLGDALTALPKEDQMSVAKILGGGYGDDAIKKLIGRTGEVQTALDSSRASFSAGESINKEYQTSIANVTDQFAILKNAVSVGLIDIGSPLLGPISSVVGALAGGVNAARQFGEAMYGVVTSSPAFEALGSAISSIAGIGSAVFGNLVAEIQPVWDALGGGAGVLSLVGSAFNLLTTPAQIGFTAISKIAGGISSLITAARPLSSALGEGMANAINTFKEAQVYVEAFWEVLSETAPVQSLIAAFEGAKEVINNVWEGLSTALPQAFGTAFDAVKSLVSGFVGWIGNQLGVDNLLPEASDLAGGIIDSLGLEGVVDFFKDVGDRAGDKMATSIKESDVKTAGPDALKGQKAEVEAAAEDLGKAAGEEFDKAFWDNIEQLQSQNIQSGYAKTAFAGMTSEGQPEWKKGAWATTQTIAELPVGVNKVVSLSGSTYRLVIDGKDAGITRSVDNFSRTPAEEIVQSMLDEYDTSGLGASVGEVLRLANKPGEAAKLELQTAWEFDVKKLEKVTTNLDPTRFEMALSSMSNTKYIKQNQWEDIESLQDAMNKLGTTAISTDYSYASFKNLMAGYSQLIDKFGASSDKEFRQIADSYVSKWKVGVRDVDAVLKTSYEGMSEDLSNAMQDGFLDMGAEAEEGALKANVAMLQTLKTSYPLEWDANDEKLLKDTQSFLDGKEFQIDVAATVKPIFEDWTSKAYQEMWRYQNKDFVQNFNADQTNSWMKARANISEITGAPEGTYDQATTNKAKDLSMAMDLYEMAIKSGTASEIGIFTVAQNIMKDYEELEGVIKTGKSTYGKALYENLKSGEHIGTYRPEDYNGDPYAIKDFGKNMILTTEKGTGLTLDELSQIVSQLRGTNGSIGKLWDDTKDTEINTRQATKHIEFLKAPTGETAKNTLSASLNTEKAALASADTKEAVATLGTPLDGINQNTTTANKILAEISAKFTTPTTINNYGTSTTGSQNWDYMNNSVGTAAKGAKLPSKQALKDALIAANARYIDGGVPLNDGLGWLDKGDIVIGADGLPCAVSSQYGVLESPDLFNQKGLGSVTSSSSGITYDTKAYSDTIRGATKNTGEFSSCIESAWHQWQMSKADELFYQTQGIKSTRTATQSYEKATVAANSCAGACDVLGYAAVQAAGGLNIERVSYNKDTEKYSYVPPSGYDLKNIMMGRVPDAVFSEYKAVTSEVDTLNKKLAAQKEIWLSCWDISSDYSRWLWQPEQQATLYQGSYIGPKAGYQSWADSGKQGTVGWNAIADLLGGAYENEPGRQFRDNNDPTAILAQSKFSSSLQAHVDAPTGKLKITVDQNTGLLSKVNEGTNKLTSSLDANTDSNDNVWAAIDRQIQADKEGQILQYLGNTAQKGFRLSEFDAYIASAESGLSSCIESLSDFAIWQEGIFGAAGGFNETYIGLTDGWAGPGKGAKEGYSGPNFQDFMPDWGPFAAEASRRWNQQASSDSQANQLLGKIGESSTSTAKSTMTQASAMNTVKQYSERDAVLSAAQKAELAAANIFLTSIDTSTAAMAHNAYFDSKGTLVYGGGGSGGSGSGGYGGGRKGGSYGSFYGNSWYTGGASGLNQHLNGPGASQYPSWMTRAWGGAIQYAEGGIITSPTLAVMGELFKKEAVVPLDDKAAGMRILKKILPGFGISLNAGEAVLSHGSIPSNVPVTITGNNATRRIEIKIDARMNIEKVDSSIDLEEVMAVQREKIMKEIQKLEYIMNGGNN